MYFIKKWGSQKFLSYNTFIKPEYPPLQLSCAFDKLSSIESVQILTRIFKFDLGMRVKKYLICKVLFANSYQLSFTFDHFLNRKF